jgi:hypothetical protein
MTALMLLLAFAAFMLTVWSVYATNRSTLARYGYVPFSLPNAAFMLIPNGLCLTALALSRHGFQLAPAGAGSGLGLLSLVILSVVAAAGMFYVISRRTNAWVAAYTVILLWAGGAVLIFSIGFWTLAMMDRGA